MITAHILRYVGVALGLALASAGTGFGQGLVGIGAMQALWRQTMGSEGGFRSMVLGLALTETGALLTLVFCLMLFFAPASTTIAGGVIEMGMVIALGAVSCCVSIASSAAVRHACTSIARQPFFAKNVMTFMLLVQSVIEAPVVFTFIIALLSFVERGEASSIADGVRIGSALLVMMVGSIGPAIGQMRFAAAATSSVGLNREAYGKLLPFALLNAAVIGTPVIFSLVIALMLIYLPVSGHPLLAAILAPLAALVVGIGGLGVGISTGHIASKSCLQVALHPTRYAAIIRTTLISQAFVESAVIYSLIIALFIMVSR